MRFKRIWVDPDFARFIKQKAVENDKSIVDYTKELTRRGDKLKAKQINDNFWELI